MHVRMRILLGFVLSFFLLTIAWAKKKDEVPALVLKARTVAVLIDPDAGVAINSPLANKTAQDDVEKALMKWGRFKFVLDPQSADLVIVIRKGSGKIVQQTIGGLPTNDRPVIVQQTDSSIRIGGQQGRAPGAPQQPMPQETNPSPQIEAGSPDDMFYCLCGAGRQHVVRFASCRLAVFEQERVAFARRAGGGGIPQGHRSDRKAAEVQALRNYSPSGSIRETLDDAESKPPPL